jgi:hypothetical protein
MTGPAPRTRTEINVGRFFTTHQFFTALGLKLPYICVKLAFGSRRRRSSGGTTSSRTAWCGSEGWISCRCSRPWRRSIATRPSSRSCDAAAERLFLDFDGTLVDVRERHDRTYRATVEAFAGAPARRDGVLDAQTPPGAGGPKCWSGARSPPKWKPRSRSGSSPRSRRPAGFRLDRLLPGVRQTLAAR